MKSGDGMKILIVTLFFISLVILGICIYKTNKDKRAITKTVMGVLVFGFVIVFVHSAILLAPNETVAKLSYSVYSVSALWLLYYLLSFSIEFIGEKMDKHVNKKLMLFLLAADSVSLLLNNVFGHVFDVKKVSAFGDEFYDTVYKPVYYIHYVLIIMLIVFSLISLYYQSVKSPLFYRRKYFVIAVMLTLIAAVNLLSQKSAVDFSIIGYAIEAVCIYYCALVYTPQRLLSKTILNVTDEMHAALYVMDMEGQKMYSNPFADRLFGGESPAADRNGITLMEWCSERYLKDDSEFTEEKSFYRDGEELILKIQLQRVFDSKKKLQGGCYVIQDSTEEYSRLKREMYLASHDGLTGLYNKEHFYTRSRSFIEENPEKNLLMICTDIKDFKMINDFFGTNTGDEVLKAFGEMLRNHIKSGAVYGRLANDIFGILMDSEDFDENRFIAESQAAFASSLNINTFPAVNYVGVYEVADRSLPVSVMCDRARMAIRTIKGDYSKRTAYYDDALRDNILYEQELISELNNAINENQFRMFLQPQMSSDGKLLGAEALVRWFHPAKGQIMPSDFIPIFEKNGLISEVDRYIWELACKQLKKWKDEGKGELYISVNISPRDFYFLNIYKIFTELIKKYDISPSSIKLEITETAIVMDFQRQLELITKLRQNGFVVEMDDFGSGYSSLNMLKDLHVDVLKIDMAFLKKAEDEERSKKILQMIISLSKQLDMPVITEGVETAEQVRFLSEMGCDIFQGYYFAKPMDIDSFEKLYRKMNE